MGQNKNEEIDNYLKIKRQSLLDLEKATECLYAMGIREFSQDESGVPQIFSTQKLLPRFELTLEDFEWKAIYDDGTELDQYAGDKQYHFGHIDQKRLSKIMYISNFEVDTPNIEKRLVVTLNFKDGTFEFLNCCSMDVRGQLNKSCLEEKKLILFKRKRETFTAGIDKEKQTIIPTGGKIIYTRYYLGYETPNKKIVICMYPNGDIEIEENK